MFHKLLNSNEELNVDYRMLMGKEPDFADLAEVHPSVHASLSKLLQMDDVAPLHLTFQVTSLMTLMTPGY